MSPVLFGSYTQSTIYTASTVIPLGCSLCLSRACVYLSTLLVILNCSTMAGKITDSSLALTLHGTPMIRGDQAHT